MNGSMSAQESVTVTRGATVFTGDEVHETATMTARGLTIEAVTRLQQRRRGARAATTARTPGRAHARSKRSRFITLFHAATKSRTNAGCASSQA